MEHQDFLATLSEIAVAYVGFTGIVAAFRYRTDQWTQVERAFFKVMLRAGVSALFISLLPYLLHLFVSDPAWVWRLSSALVAVVMLINITASFREGVATFKIKNIRTLFFICGTLAVLANIVAFSGFFPADKVLLATLVFQLMVATYNFISLILGIPGSEDADEASV